MFPVLGLACRDDHRDFVDDLDPHFHLFLDNPFDYPRRCQNSNFINLFDCLLNLDVKGTDNFFKDVIVEPPPDPSTLPIDQGLQPRPVPRSP